MKQVKVLTVEKNDGLLWGRVDTENGFMPTGAGKNIKELTNNVKESIQDYIENEGNSDKKWNKLDVAKIEFEIVYDLEAFFMQHDFLNLSKVAERAGINRSLLNQYAAGIKHPSKEQAKKIEDTIHDLAKEMKTAKLVLA